MEKPISVRVTELASMSRLTRAAVSLAMKLEDQSLLTKDGKRVIGLPSSVVQKYLFTRGFANLYTGGLYVTNSQSGGCGKTSLVANMSMAVRRITDPKQAIILIDCDSQASLTTQMTGNHASDEESVLVGWLDGKCGVKDMLCDLGDNMWIIKSNLNNIYADKSFKRPSMIRERAKNLVDELFKMFGSSANIFVDLPPQLTTIGQSFVVAAALLKERGHLLCPVRPDLFGVKGAQICVSESFETLNDFQLPATDLNVTVFLSGLDNRKTVGIKTLTSLSRDPLLSPFLSPIAIRYSAEVAKAMSAYSSVFSVYRNATTIGQDYLDLFMSIRGIDVGTEAGIDG